LATAAVPDRIGDVHAADAESEAGISGKAPERTLQLIAGTAPET
jgi:hypothetical protein